MSNVKGKYIPKYKTFLLSTGVPSLDNLLNGGLSTSTITILEEDKENVHCSLLCEHFVACGLSNSQDTALVMESKSLDTYFNNLPKIISVKPSMQQVTDNLSDLSIAWRYKQMRPVEDDFASSRGNGSTVGINDLSKFNSHFIEEKNLSENLEDVLNFVEKFIKEKGGTRKPLRLVINSLGSPYWGGYETKQDFFQQIFRFLFWLRRLISGTMLTVVISINPEYFSHIKGSIPGIIFGTVSDYSFRFEAFEDPKSVGDQLFNDVSGFFRVVKIPCINSIEPILRPNTDIWSYHIRSKKMLFKEFSLPPCLSDTTSRSNQNDPSRMINSNNSCGVDF